MSTPVSDFSRWGRSRSRDNHALRLNAHQLC